MSEEKKRAAQAAEPQQEPDPQPAPEAPEDAVNGASDQPEAEPRPNADPETEAKTEPEEKPEPEAQAEPEAKPTGKEKEKKDWFGKKAKELEAIKAKLDTAEGKAAELKEQLLRTAAEYDNFRKRSAREADQKFNDGVSYAVNQIIPILDTLEMAAKAPCADESYKKGVTMTLDKAAKAMQTLNIAEIEAEGKPFDPNTMNAVSQVPAPEGVESGSVVTVYQKGYTLGGKVIRHATVVVAE